MKSNDCRNRWIRSILVGTIANLIMINTWFPLLFVLDPGQPYRHLSGAFACLLVIPPTLGYAVVLVFRRTSYHKLKLAAVFLNLAPILVVLLIMKLLAIMGHMPAE